MNEHILSTKFKKARTPPMRNVNAPLAPLSIASSFTEGSVPSPIKQILFQGLDGQYLAIVENGLIQSMDGGHTWGYLRPNATLGSAAWPGDAIGHQLGWSLGPRSCTPPAIVCDDFESGLGFWQIQDFINGTHSWTVAESASPTHSFLASITAAGDSVQWFRSDLSRSGPSFMHFKFKVIGAGAPLNADVSYDGSVGLFKCLLAGSRLFIQNTGADFDIGEILTDVWHEVSVGFNDSTGFYTTVTLDGVTTDISSLSAGFAGSSSHHYLFRTFFLAINGYNSYWDDICLEQDSGGGSALHIDVFPWSWIDGFFYEAGTCLVVRTYGDDSAPDPGLSGSNVSITRLAGDSQSFLENGDPAIGTTNQYWFVRITGTPWTLNQGVGVALIPAGGTINNLANDPVTTNFTAATYIGPIDERANELWTLSSGLVASDPEDITVALLGDGSIGLIIATSSSGFSLSHTPVADGWHNALGDVFVWLRGPGVPPTFISNAGVMFFSHEITAGTSLYVGTFRAT